MSIPAKFQVDPGRVFIWLMDELTGQAWALDPAQAKQLGKELLDASTAMETKANPS